MKDKGFRIISRLTCLTRISRHALERRNRSTVFTGLCRLFSAYSGEGRLLGDTERSFGVRAACCRLFPSQLAGWKSIRNDESGMGRGSRRLAGWNVLGYAAGSLRRRFGLSQASLRKRNRKPQQAARTQSFAPNASDGKSTPGPASLFRSSG